MFVLRMNRGTFTVDPSVNTLAVVSCYENAAAESFFDVLKRERVNRKRYLTRAEARSNIIDYIERFYNQRLMRHFNSGNIHQSNLN